MTIRPVQTLWSTILAVDTLSFISVWKESRQRYSQVFVGVNKINQHITKSPLFPGRKSTISSRNHDLRFYKIHFQSTLYTIIVEDINIILKLEWVFVHEHNIVSVYKYFDLSINRLNCTLQTSGQVQSRKIENNMGLSKQPCVIPLDIRKNSEIRSFSLIADEKIYTRDREFSKWGSSKISLTKC